MLNKVQGSFLKFWGKNKGKNPDRWLNPRASFLLVRRHASLPLSPHRTRLCFMNYFRESVLNHKTKTKAHVYKITSNNHSRSYWTLYTYVFFMIKMNLFPQVSKSMENTAEEPHSTGWKILTVHKMLWVSKKTGPLLSWEKWKMLLRVGLVELDGEEAEGKKGSRGSVCTAAQCRLA